MDEIIKSCSECYVSNMNEVLDSFKNAGFTENLPPPREVENFDENRMTEMILLDLKWLQEMKNMLEKVIVGASYSKEQIEISNSRPLTADTILNLARRLTNTYAAPAGWSLVGTEVQPRALPFPDLGQMQFSWLHEKFDPSNQMVVNPSAQTLLQTDAFGGNPSLRS
eukprot:GHVL01004671.1.p1 GENE.GHVL01004671.1~~GHVL01004671.1.p1  ORF type:complete len:167 (+),score=30.60 GHVL01004671.1:126-626(+)